MRALIIEDDAELHRILQMSLEAAGIEPASASSSLSPKPTPKHSASKLRAKEIRAFDSASLRNPNRRTWQQR